MSLLSFLFYAKEITEMADFKKSVSLMSNAAEAAETEIDNTEYTEEEAKSVIKANEETSFRASLMPLALAIPKPSASRSFVAAACSSHSASIR